MVPGMSGAFDPEQDAPMWANLTDEQRLILRAQVERILDLDTSRSRVICAHGWPSDGCSDCCDEAQVDWQVGDTAEIWWMDQVYRGVVVDVKLAASSRRGRTGRTWLWIEVEHDGRPLRLGYHTGEVTRV